MQTQKIKDYPNVAVAFEDLNGRVDFQQLFGRCAPVHIEIGSGKGTVLLAEAQANPQIDYLGVEWANKFYRFAVDRMGRWGQPNVRLIRADATELVADFFPNSSIQRYHVYFPDPWPKRYHHRRRFFSSYNLKHLLRTLTDDGIINLATDHKDYYNQMTKVIDSAVACGAMQRIDFIRPASAMEGEMVGSNYERKYIREGRETYVAAAQLLDRTKWVAPKDEE